ncbi:MAG: nucleotidyltransferase family protein, partial [Ktedonobacterales bacterium]
MIAAVILAAGQSKRMGQPKMMLPWHGTSVLGRVIEVFKAAGIEEAVVVTGGNREGAEQIAQSAEARTVFNEDYASQEMLSSLQAGLRALEPAAEAALIALGDQPQIREDTIRVIVERYEQTHAPLVVPSYQMRRGHPWLVTRVMWEIIFGMRSPETPRDFLRKNGEGIVYVELDT